MDKDSAIIVILMHNLITWFVTMCVSTVSGYRGAFLTLAGFYLFTTAVLLGALLRDAVVGMTQQIRGKK